MEALLDCGVSTRKGTRRSEDRFCCVGFWPTVDVQEVDGVTSTEVGNFESFGNPDIFGSSPGPGPPVFHSVMRQKNFCSVWEAQDRATLLHEAIHGQFINLEFYKTHRTFVPQSFSLDLDHILTKFTMVEHPNHEHTHCRQQLHVHDLPAGFPYAVCDNPGQQECAEIDDNGIPWKDPCVVPHSLPSLLSGCQEPQSPLAVLIRHQTQLDSIKPPGLPEWDQLRPRADANRHAPPTGPPPDVRDNPEWRDPNRPHFDDMPIWVHHLWHRLEEEGAVENEDEGPVAYFNTFYISHHTNQRQDFGRQLRLDSAFQSWATEIQQLWQDFFDHSMGFDAMLVTPESPVIASDGSSGTVLVVQHPNPDRAACLTTALIPDIPTFRVIEVAHSFETIIGQRALLYYAGVLDLCNHRIEQYVGECTIRVGRYHYPPNRPVRVHEGLGILIDVPPPMSQQDWEDRLVRQLHDRAGQVHEPRFEDEEPHDETGLLARSPVNSLNTGGPSAPGSMSSSLSSRTSTSSSRASESSAIWHLAIVFSLQGGEREIELPWHDGEEMYERIAYRFGLLPHDIASVHTVIPCPDDIVQDDRRALLLALQSDFLQPADQQMVLVDIEYKEDADGPTSRIDRRVRRIPQSITRASVIRLCGYDGHCSQDPSRCWVWLNHEYIPEDSPTLTFAHGNYLRVGIPAHPERQICETGEAYWPPDLDDFHDVDLSGIDTSSDEHTMLQSHVIHHKLDQPDVCEAPVFEACRDQAAPVAWIRPHGGNEAFQLHQDPLWALWNRPRLRTRGIANEEVMIFDTWYLSSLGFPRCSFSRAVALDADIDSWITKIRTVWRDRLHPHMPVELAIVNPPLEGQTHGGHFILLQSVSPDEKATILSSYWSSLSGDLNDRFAQLVPRRLSFPSLLQFNDLEFLCAHGDFHCTAHVGDQMFEEHEAWPIYHGMHIEIVITPRLAPVVHTPVQMAIDMELNQTAEHQAFQLQASAPAFDPALPALESMTQFVQTLHPLWFSLAFTWEGEGSTADVVTWFVDHRNPDRRACDVLPHVILVQNPHERLATSILSVFETTTSSSRLASQTAITTLAQIHLDHLLQGLGLHDRCLLPTGDLQCAAWHDNEGITASRPLHGQNGLSIILELRPRVSLAPSSTDDDAVATEGVSLLQRAAQLRPVLRLDELLPDSSQAVPLERLTTDTVAHGQWPSGQTTSFPEIGQYQSDDWINASDTQIVEVFHNAPLHLSALMPSYLEMPTFYTKNEAVTELAAWGFHCECFICGVHDSIFAFFEFEEILPEDTCVYVYCNKQSEPGPSVLIHSSTVHMDEHAHMRFLHLKGCTKSVIWSIEQWKPCLFCVHFEDVQPQHEVPARPLRLRTPWPTRQPTPAAAGSILPIVDQLPEPTSSLLALDLQALAQIQENFSMQLWLDYHILDLPDFIKDALDACLPIQRIDRYVIYTDGSSQTRHRHRPPEWVAEHDTSDSWAFAVFAEQYSLDPSQPSIIQFLGFQCQQILYESNLPHHIGTTRIGSDSSETEALFWAGLWRLASNDRVPTVFVSDSHLVGDQAAGRHGSQIADAPFYHLRALFQALAECLPGDALRVEHVRSHAGDPFNEFVDLLAKREGQSSLFLRRQPVDMQRFGPVLRHLWMILSSKPDVPGLTKAGCDISKFSLPVRSDPDEIAVTTDRPAVLGTPTIFALAFATANVRTFYRGDLGFSGKLAYVRSQFASHHLNFLGVQEARTDPGSSCQHGVLRLAGGGEGGHLGVELWVNLGQPFGWQGASPCHFHRSDFVVVDSHPRHLLVHAKTERLDLWILVAHAPHSGQGLQDREEWWQKIDDLLSCHVDRRHLVVLIDANAATGPADDQHVFLHDDVSTANTPLLRNLLHAQELCVPASTAIHHGEQATWISPVDDSQHRIDYVLVPCWWLPSCSFSMALDSLDFGHLGDHRATAVQVQWQDASLPLPSKHTKFNFDRTLIDKTNMKQCFETYEPCAWQQDIEFQVNHLNQHLLTSMTQYCAKVPQGPKKPFITDDIWQVRIEKLRLQRRQGALRRLASQDLLRRCFAGWTHIQSDDSQQSTWAYSCRISLQRLLTGLRLHVTARKLRTALSSAKRHAIAAAIQNLPEDSAASQILHILKPILGPTNPKLQKSSPLPAVVDEDGNPCTTPTSLRDRWISFFAAMEGG
eukprot:s3230_g3.t1